MTARTVALVALLAWSATAAAQDGSPAGAQPAERDWAAVLYVDAYFLPGESGYLNPTLLADRGPFHLELRYAKLTPMLGAVAGSTSGVAPGLEVDAAWGRLTLWLEAEYLFDLTDSGSSYLYTWSELYVTVVPWLWAGASVQRTRVVESPTELDVGPMIGLGDPEGRGWSLSAYAYGLPRSSPTCS
jgi:hypothetical protein